MEQKVEYNTCAFIDVLGYGEIVTSTEKSTEKKLQILESMFSNLQASISHVTIKDVQLKNRNEKLFLKSYSDSVYIQSDNAYTVLFCLYNIFSVSFGYYSNFTYNEHHTVLLLSLIHI